LRDVGSNWWTAERRRMHHFVRVELNRSTARVTAMDINGSTFDSFWMEN
jgi:hypothetical protein